MSNGAIVPQKQALKNFRATLQRMKPQVAMALPKNLDPDRMLRMAMTVVQENPKLLTDCTMESLLGCIMQSAQLGLYPDTTVLGHAHFVKYGNKCTFIAGYKGLIDLATRTDRVTSIMAYAVREGDSFEFEYGLDPFLRHKPSGEPIEEREITHVYAIARIKGEPIPQFVVMTKEEVDKIRARSAAFRKGQGPWITDYEAMAIKTVIRRLVKYLPISSDLQRAVALDEHAEIGLDQGLDSVGQEVLDGLADIDDDVVEGEIIEDGDGEPKQSTLDGLAQDLEGGGKEIDEFTKVWAVGNDKFGDEAWQKEMMKIKRSLKLKSGAAMTKAQKTKAIEAMRASIEKGE
jgi:recombination protein RecT